MSPVMQNAAFRYLNIDAVYVPFHVRPSCLKPAVQGLRALNVRGFNVTIPHKIRIIGHLDQMHRSASEVGSVNTVVNSNGKLRGYNTDGIGAVRALEEAGVSLAGQRVLIIGAGGAARALAFELARHTKQLSIVNRTISKARALERALTTTHSVETQSSKLTRKTLTKLIRENVVIINATSMGMKGKNALPITDGDLLADHSVLDLVYDPPETGLLKCARRGGARCVNGLDMLIQQGAASFEIWTGKSAPMLEMRHAIAQRLLVIDHGRDG